jgi:hypothetical protein
MSTINGIPKVLGVWPGRFDHQVESTGAVDVARIAVRLIRRMIWALWKSHGR